MKPKMFSPLQMLWICRSLCSTRACLRWVAKRKHCSAVGVFERYTTARDPSYDKLERVWSLYSYMDEYPTRHHQRKQAVTQKSLDQNQLSGGTGYLDRH